MNYEQAMIAVTKPGYFNRKVVREACAFVINCATPPAHIHCDHAAHQNQARVVDYAMGNDWQIGE